MISSGAAVTISRTLAALGCVIVWTLLYTNARAAYRPPSTWKNLLQLMRLGLAITVFMLQVNLMEHLAPGDAYGKPFLCFVMIECGGGIVLLFTTLMRERAKSIEGNESVSRNPKSSEVD
jgi:hypothetical protein